MTALPLRGREGELGVVVALMADLQAGCGGVILVEGWPGIGKSRFLAEAGRLGLDVGMLLAAGRADEIEAMAPLSPLLSALSSGDRPVLARQRLRALERPGDQRFWLVEELAELLELRSRETPLVISLDDLQWADPATIWAVQALSQRLLSSPVGWLMAVRPGPMPSGLPRLLSELTVAGASRIELGPLSVSDTEALAASLLGGSPDPQLRSFLVGAGGNPFLSLELLQALLADESISVIDGVASVVMHRRSGTLPGQRARTAGHVVDRCPAVPSGRVGVRAVVQRDRRRHRVGQLAGRAGACRRRSAAGQRAN